jgi:hypothetical protein
LPDLLPDAALAVEPDGVDLLDLDDATATAARHPQKMLGNFGQSQRAAGRSGGLRSDVGARVVENGFPIFRWQVFVRSQCRRRGGLSADEQRSSFPSV